MGLTNTDLPIAATDMTRRAVLGASLALPIAGPLAGCGRARDPARLSFWAMDVEAENAKFILPRFTRATGLPVDLQWLAWTAAHEKLLTAHAGGSLPDVVMLARNWVAEFATIDAIRPLPAGDADLLGDCYAPHDLRIGGRDLAVPWTLDTPVQYYRRDLLARAGYDVPPTGLDAWKVMLRAVKRVQGDDRFAVLMQLNWPDHLFHIAEQQPDPLLVDRQSRGNFRSPGFRAVLGYYVSLFEEKLAPRVTSIEAFDPAGELVRGWVAVHGSGAWTRAELLRRRALLSPDRWMTATLPGQGRDLVAGAVLCVSRSAADPARAWALVRYLCAPATQLQFARVAGTLPSRPSAWAAPPIARDPAMTAFRRALDSGVPNRNLIEWDRIATEVQRLAEQAVRGRLTIDAAAAEMDRRADALLAKRRWLLERGRIA